MATIKFQLRSEANKAVPIYFYLSMGRGSFFRIRTGFSILPSNWSKAKGFPKQNDTANKNTESNLKSLEKHLLECINEAQAKGEEINKEFLERKTDACFHREIQTDVSLVSYQVQYIIDHADTRKIQGKSKIGLAPNTVKNYQTFKNIVLEFEKSIKKPLRFRDLSPELVEKFKNWLLKKKGYSVNHAGKSLAFLKSVSKDAEKLGVAIHPNALKIEAFTESNEDRYIVTLSFDELNRIEKAELTRDALINARMWLLLGCELGQRGEDLMKIRLSDIRTTLDGQLIDVYQQKGKKHVSVPITPRAQRILAQGFPEKIALSNFNDYIKDVCKEAGLDEITDGKKMDPETKRKVFGKYPKHELITSHACRRSFATNYYKRIPTTVIMGITGHTKESTFLQYINKPKDKDENAKLFLSYL
ncbi:MAG: phage integrase SAM-like domain-containing protein [Algoriphagus sp.]|uniref:tyrosine-type recombinase/integrase n=1 Tax=Algoriphagus sp. TaxID=1872435 RepID=UPI00261FEFAF|nr:phage integrase SAM-like domain-containing protein [Algoriphagus sp.]MDG1276914.1 phage integrase SAM-like domain-containing protein [Algoriphagus sp.]